MDQSHITKEGIRIHAREDFAGMHKAGAVASQILDEVGPLVQPGVTTGALDDFITPNMQELGVTSATIGYRGYEHVTVIVDGWYGDTSRMYVAGRAPIKARRLIQVTHDALMKGIEAVRPGATFGDIGAAIQTYAEGHGMSVVRDFCGHGLGRVFHAPPNVLHFGRSGKGPMLEEGMFFTIEPMINLGRPETKVLADDWTAVTRDKSLSAQFEHAIGVTAHGCEIFTGSDKFFPSLD